MAVDKAQLTIAQAVRRAELAGEIAKRLLMFPLAPQLGDSWDQHAKCLEVAFTQEILAALNKEAARGE